MERKWKLVGRNQIQDAVNVVLDKNAFDPVREYLDSLTWDGVERIETLLCRYMGAEDNPYVRAVTRKWMCAAVKRIYQPGCKFDHALVLAGPQGIGKSNLGRKLGRGWHTDSLGRLDNSREAMERLAGKWIVEVAELAALKRSEVEDVKTFITKEVDDYRKVYNHHNGDYRRRCVFYGTTNNAEFLSDRTGSRRFWIVDVPGIDHGWLRGLDEEVDQLWAEAVVLMRRGEVLEITDESVLTYAKEVQENHSYTDVLVDEIYNFLETPRPERWYEMTKEARRRWWVQFGSCPEDAGEPCTLRLNRVCAPEIYYELCGENPAQGGGNNLVYRNIRNILNTTPGWSKSRGRARTDYGILTVWDRTS
jgi:predicted P-loop ATPase